MICSMLLKLKFGGDNPHRISLDKREIICGLSRVKKNFD